MASVLSVVYLALFGAVGLLALQTDNHGHQEEEPKAISTGLFKDEEKRTLEVDSVRSTSTSEVVTVTGTSYLNFIVTNPDYMEVRGPMSTFVPKPFHNYNVRADVKLGSDVKGKLGQNLLLMPIFVFQDGKQRFVKAALHPMVRKEHGWVRVHGDFRSPGAAEGLKEIRLRINGPAGWVKYQVTNVTISEMLHISDWRQHTDRMIDQHRKSDIHFNITTDDTIDMSEVEIQVTQTSKSFPLGTAVNSWAYTYSGNGPYRDFIHQHFSWAVHESAMKWFNVEKQEDQYSWDLPLGVLRSLRDHGLKVRGHALMWSVDSLVPRWVKALPTEDRVRAAVENRISITLNKTRGLFEHWDVNNENVHGFWYQERLKDFDYELTPLRLAHQHVDNNTALFLNDYSVVAHGSATGAFVAQARRMMAANVGVDALGVQCHFYREERPNIVAIKERLDRLAELGLPVWITEFNIVAMDEARRAHFVDLAMRAFYSHPAVEGILLWGFWDRSHSRGPYAALTTGKSSEFRLTQAGRKFLDLWEREWMTRETVSVGSAGPAFTLRAFHGDYQVRVLHRGSELPHLATTFQLGKQPLNLHIALHQ